MERGPQLTRIYAQKDDCKGRAFVLYYTDFGRGATISGEMSEGVPVSTVAATAKWHRSENIPRI